MLNATFTAALALALAWAPQTSNTTASLRGLCAISSQIAWASGTNGTYLITTDGGRHWRAATVAGAESLDFRAIKAFDNRTAYLLSSGEGKSSRVYKTTEGGRASHLLFTNPDPKGFFDALAFWDERHGIILGDPVNGYFAIFTTDDGGKSWRRQQSARALPSEGAFAASGTCLRVRGTAVAWFATGGIGAARVFHTLDGGHSWIVSATPLQNTSNSAGIFSLAFADVLHGIAVGGDYQKPQERGHTSAITEDGGKTWSQPASSGLSGYRSAVVFLPKPAHSLLAVGTSGSDVSLDGGQTWKAFSAANFNAVDASPDGAVWAAGPHGAIAKLLLTRE